MGDGEALGVYAECDFRKLGVGVDALIFDPPIPLPLDTTISPVKVTLIEWHLSTYIADWVNAFDYPLPCDLIEYVRKNGLRWPLSVNTSFPLLKQDSHLLLVHGKAGIDNWKSYPSRTRPCPKGKHSPGEFCAGLWWEDLPPTGEGSKSVVKRSIQSVEYVGQMRPSTVQPDYMPMIFISFPIHHLVMVGEGASDFARRLRSADVRLPIIVE